MWRREIRVHRSRIVLLLASLLFVPTQGSAALPADVRPAEGAPAAALTRVYLGMWTSHVREPARGLDANSLIGLAVRGYYGATFVNSYGNRAFAAGIQRTITARQGRAVRSALGYRAGLVTGYDERFLPVAASVPAIPFAQVVGSLDHRSLGVELAYAGVVASLLVNWRP
jgi:hypothetical protein